MGEMTGTGLSSSVRRGLGDTKTTETSRASSDGDVVRDGDAAGVTVGRPGVAPVGPADSRQHWQALPGPSEAPGRIVLNTTTEQDDDGSTGSFDASAAAAAVAPASAAPRPIRRRMRMITSCLECRRAKTKCNRSQPCSNCVRMRRECRYLGPKLDEAGVLRLTALKDKVGSLERQLEQDVVGAGDPGRRSRQAHYSSTSHPQHPQEQSHSLADDVEQDEDAEFFDEAGGLEPTGLAAIDAAYDDGVDVGADDVVDLGVLVGKMRITDRISGLSRPKLAEEISAGILRRNLTPQLTATPPLPQHHRQHPHQSSQQQQQSAADAPAETMFALPNFLLPSANYIPPSSGLVLGQPASGSPPLEALLPTRPAADFLIRQYFEAVHPIARCVHRPSFEDDYHDFWTSIYSNIEPRPSLQAIIFSAMFAGAVSMDDATAEREFGKPQRKIFESLKLGAETALAKANFLRTTRIETVQALVVYLVCLCRDEVSRAHSVLVGAAVRMAECMGLHRDGSTYGLNALDTHVRRLLWHQLCFLDIRTAEAQGPRPAIRRDEYDTRLPINCEEEQFFRPSMMSGHSQQPMSMQPEPESLTDRWTSGLFVRMRSELSEMMRKLWIERRKLEQRRQTLAGILSKIGAFRRGMLDRYDCLLDGNIPIQRYARLVMNLFIYRLYAMTLHVFHATMGQELPPRLRNVLVTSAIMITEIGIQLDTDPQLSPWAWYSGAFHQYQISLLLAMEVYTHPQHPEAERMARCLDYVFDTDRGLTADAKGLQVLTESMQKTAVYQQLRKSRLPLHLARAVSADTSTGSGQTGSQVSTPPDVYAATSKVHAADPTGMGTMSMPATAQIGHQPVQSAMSTVMPPPGTLYAGVSEGEALWAMDAGNAYMETQYATRGVPTSAPAGDMPLTIPELDWDVINGLFMNNPDTGDLSIMGYDDPALSMNWRRWD